MPEEIVRCSDLPTVLDHLEDHCLDNHLSRTQNYITVQSVLERKESISVKEIERLLAVCVHDLKEERKYAATILDIIFVIVNRVEEGAFDPQPDLVPSAEAVLHITKIAALGDFSKSSSLKKLCFRTLLSYSDETLLAATENKNELVQIFELYISNEVSQVKLQALTLLKKLLKVMPRERRKSFIEAGLDVWFAKMIPTTMSLFSRANQDCVIAVECLELLTDTIVNLDYKNNESWNHVITCLCNPQGYPHDMKNQLLEGNELWQRVWIVFIRLLRHQITQSMGNIGSPINSMLPVVEVAFKLDVTNRCKAFKCWNVLIDSFSTETNESNINKRIKLLIIPLKSNNAKTEETALAKFHCWWHLIRKFQNKMDKFLDMILISFLHFCFGKHCLDKSIFVPGQISIKVQKECTYAMVEMLGHTNCNGCTDLPKLTGKVINTKHLVDNWNDWIFSLTTTIVLTTTNEDGLTDAQMMCLWKSFLVTIGELPENNIRKDLVVEMISVISRLVKECRSNNRLASFMFNVLILSFFDEEIKIRHILKSEEDEADPLYRILKVMLEPSLDIIHRSHSMQELVTKVKPLTNFCLNSIYSPPTYVTQWLLTNLPQNDTGLMLWTALIESLHENQCKMLPALVGKLVLWPLKSIHLFTDIKTSAMTWVTIYNVVNQKKIDIEKDLSIFLNAQIEANYLTNNTAIHSTTFFKLCVLSAVLTHKLKEKSLKYQTELEIFKNLTSAMDAYSNYEQVFPMIVTVIKAIVASIINMSTVDESIALHILGIIKNLFNVITPVCHVQSEGTKEWSLLENLLKSLGILCSIKAYSNLTPIITNDLIEHSSLLVQQTSTKTILLKTMRVIISNIGSISDPLYVKIQNKLDEIENGTTCKSIPSKHAADNNKDFEQEKFPTPNAKDVPRKTKKKETSIVKTTVENGEEYVVVKSNWKFNPRKLTENQKEKFQRKREDIPALYQDLSQSQDEFKLVSWKMDSQDTTSSSKSESKPSNMDSTETATEILKKIPSSNVVPNILESFFLEKANKESTNKAKDLLVKDTVNEDSVTPSGKNTKSPRMALKDKVFRNVRNLIEKSGIQKENKDVSEDLNKTMNICKTPTHIKPSNSDNVANSAPPMLSADRPSRVKRKPRKFEDLELLTSKKIRHYANDLEMDAKLPNQDIEKTSVHKVISIIENDVPTKTIANDNIKINDTKSNGSCNSVVTTDEIVDKEKVEEESKNKMDAVEQTINLLDSEVEENKPVVTDKILNVQKKPHSSGSIPIVKVIETGEKDDNESLSGHKAKIKVDFNKGASTPKVSKNKNGEEQKCTPKKVSDKKSRIEKELAIDMVEGHPFLKNQNEKRLTRKALESTNSLRRKSVTEKLNKSKSEVNLTAKVDKKFKEKSKISPSTSIVVDESQDKDSQTRDESSFSDDLPFSDDIIESSQDSTATTISVKSTKKTSKKVPVVTIEKIMIPVSNQDIVESQSILECVAVNTTKSSTDKQDSKDDIELPVNKTVLEDKSEAELTENMDTEPMESKDLSDVIVINNVPEPITVSDEIIVGTETQEIAEADTQPTDLKEIMDIDETPEKITESLIVVDLEKSTIENINDNHESPDHSFRQKSLSPTDETETFSVSACAEIEKKSDVSSSFTDEAKRKEDFLNNTLEISPIKTMSPDRNKKSPSPETSRDYVVIQLSSPVQSNGEPFEKSGSPEVFTEEKVSPEKRDQSPPRTETTVTSSSPSSSLSLKKNRPQVRAGGRGAQMLGLCVPDKVHAIVNPERTETEEVKKCSTPNMQARRNLRILYSSVSDNTETTTESEDSENFLKFRRSLPAVDSSPSGPILKRKLAEIDDEVSISPASKRKRVSFHDPPVSTTVSVQKYIESSGVRSPSNSAQKRLERQLRQHTPIKSPKRLANVFKLDTVLTKAVESFSDADVIITSDDTQAFSIEVTPVVEIVRASELNDTDPICPELMDCKDPIDNIATELSSSAMKSLLVKELEGKIETVGDLAKMTELEVNRLCIKAPKVKVAKKVLADYASKRVANVVSEKDITVDAAVFDEPMVIEEIKGVHMEIQTDKNETCEMEVQTVEIPTNMNSSQTDMTPTEHTFVQTEESGSKSTEDIIKTCMSERSDFVEQLSEHLEESSVLQICDRLTFSAATELLMKKITPSNCTTVLSGILHRLSSTTSEEQLKTVQMAFIRDFICKNFDAKDLALFCSDVLKTAFEKPA